MRSFLTVAAHVGAAFLMALGLSCLVSIGLAFHGGVIAAVLAMVVFVVFSLFGLALSAALIAALCSFDEVGNLINFVLGGLLGALFIGLATIVVPGIVVATVAGCFVFGFIGSALVVGLGLMTGCMSTRMLPVRAKPSASC